MLDPQTRSLLLEALVPPEGFQLDEGIGTSYTLDLISLLSVPLAFTLFEWEDADGKPTSNPILLLEALRRHSGRLTLFCQAGRISLPSRSVPLFGYLEESVVQVDAGSTGIFHPKLWVMRYLNPEGAVRYRLLCLSRNLTGDDCWDLSLVLEGDLVARKNAFAKNHPLADFIAALPGLALGTAREEVKKRCQRLADELRRVDFVGNLPDPFEDLAFHPLGIQGYRAQPLPDRWDSGLVASPFVDEETLEDLSEGTEGSVLISRTEELNKVRAKSLEGWSEVLVLAPSAEGEFEPEQEDAEPRQDRPRGLHAKLYVCDNGWNSHVFVGSANATTAAFKRNVEFLVELIGKKSKVGVRQLLSGDEGQASFRSLLMRYEPPNTPAADDSVERLLEERLDLARLSMARAGWRFVAEGTGAGLWRPNLVRESAIGFEIPEGVKLRAWPITIPELSGSRGITAETSKIEFPEVGAAALTTFLACEAEATVGSASDQARFVLSIPLEGAPAGRREAILRVILDDPQKVLRFLQLLLDDGTAALPEPMPGSANAEGQGLGGRREEFILLESLLRTLAYNPSRLDEVESLLRELGSGDEGRSRVPPGLLEVWPAIWAARKAIPA